MAPDIASKLANLGPVPQPAIGPAHPVRPPRIPDLLTTANLCCGVGSILLASQGQLTIACWLVFAGAAFDVLDGLAARALGGGSELGKQLDSLADMVTFGVAPAFLVLLPGGSVSSLTDLGLVHIGALLMTIASAWRLARFNVDERQSSSFLGLPTPANAMLWASMMLAVVSHGPNGLLGLEGNLLIRAGVGMVLDQPWTILASTTVCSYLMLSPLPLPSLKIKHFGWRGNEVIYLLGGIGMVLVVLYGIMGVPLLIALYIVSPMWGRMFGKTA